MTADNQRARRARTVEARNGARVILPPGTTTVQLWDFALREAYAEPLAELLRTTVAGGGLAADDWIFMGARA
jgi:hypothetical protein